MKLLEEQLFKAGFEQVLIIPDGKNGEEILFRVGLEHRSMNNPLDVVLLADFICKKFGVTPEGISLFRKGQILNEYKLTDNGLISSNFVSDSYVRDFHRGFDLNKYRLNTFITPDLKVRFGNFVNPLQTKLNLIIGSEVVLFRGLSLFSGISIPILNDLDNQEMSFTLAPTYLEYFTQFLNGHFFQFSGGTFFNNRYGLDYQYKYFNPNFNWSIGLRYAYNGFYFFPSSSFYFENFDNQLVLIDFEYFFGIKGSVL